MKFKGEPNLLVRINKPIGSEVRSFSFDENGIYETIHPTTIKRLQGIYEQIEEENNATEEVKGEEIKEVKKCKKCDFVTDNQGELLQHYRKNHPPRKAVK